MGINFDSLPKENPFALPAPGVYRAQITEAEMKAAKDDSKPPYLNLKYTLTDKDGKGCGNIYDIISESDSSVVQYKIGRFIRAVGIPLSGSMELSDLAKIVKGRELVVDITHDKKSDTPRAQVDLFSRQAYYLASEFEEIWNIANPDKAPQGDLNEFNSGEEDTPFNAADGAPAINTPAQY